MLRTTWKGSCTEKNFLAPKGLCVQQRGPLNPPSPTCGTLTLTLTLMLEVQGEEDSYQPAHSLLLSGGPLTLVYRKRLEFSQICCMSNPVNVSVKFLAYDTKFV